MIALTTGDGGALFRFTDVYARMTGGQMVIAMDAPSAENPVQQGSITVRQFAVHDEAQLQHAVNTSDPQVQRNVMEFSSMRVDFDKSPGRVVLRDGVVRGPMLGATIDGMIDYSRDELHLRGTLVPLYGPNNLLGQLPILGLFLGGEKEGLARHYLRSRRQAGQSGAAHQSDFGAGAGPVAQGVRISDEQRHLRREQQLQLQQQ